MTLDKMKEHLDFYLNELNYPHSVRRRSHFFHQIRHYQKLIKNREVQLLKLGVSMGTGKKK